MAKVFDAIDAQLAAWIGRQRMFFVGHRAERRRRPRQRLAQGPDREPAGPRRAHGRLPRPRRQRRGDHRAPARQRAHRRDALRLRGAAAHPAPARPRRGARRPTPSSSPASTALPEQQRTVIRVDVERIADSCGFGVPLMDLRRRAPAVRRRGRESKLAKGGPRALDEYVAREERAQHRRAARARLTAMRFEKWQALGNDYVIVEAADARRGAPTPALVRALCDRHTGIGADGVLVLAPPGRARLRRAPADLQPRRLGGRAERQRRARGDPVPAPRRLDRRAPVLDPDGRRRDPPDDPLRHDLPRRHGPRVACGHAGEAARLPLPAPVDRQPADGDPRRRPRDARGAGPRRHRPADRDRPAVPATARTSRGSPSSTPRRIRARIFERGVGETASSGTGACGAAIAHVLRGGDSPVTVGSTAASSRSRSARTSTST